MKFYLIYLASFLLLILLAPQVQAAEAYCSLNDGMKADGKTMLEHGGAKHEFCCSGCLDKFKANPENFSHQVQQPSITSAADAEAACSSVCSE